MKKKELILSLKRFVDDGPCHGGRRWRGQKPFALFFAKWLDRLDIKGEKYDFWDIDSYVPQLAVDAYENLRTGTDDLATEYRRLYKRDTERDVPNLTELGASCSLDQGMVVQTTGFLLEDVMDSKWVASQFDAYANAQRHVLQLTFDKFLRLVFRKGLYDLIQKAEGRGMSSKFGETDLRTAAAAGRLMFTFARRLPDATEISVSFLAEDDDPVALSAGIQSEHASLCEGMAMIEDVIQGWPADTMEQVKAHGVSESVGFGF